MLLALAGAVQAQGAPPDATTLDRIEVVGRQRPLAEFPGAVGVLDGDTLRRGQHRVGLAEALPRLPGVSVLDRQNYAQDLQIQSRGFGARSTFGIRGIRLVVDGIPLTAADGQGQAASFPLDTLDRIEVLRGPLALQYGNAAGGVIAGYTRLDGRDRLSADAWVGSDDSHRLAARIDGGSDDATWRWRLHGSRFVTDGPRARSAAERSHGSAVLQWSPRQGERVRLVLNALSQPGTHDPLGLSREHWQREPHGTAAQALQFNTRKRIENHQAGLSWERDYAPGRAFSIAAHRIHRDVLQFLSIPPAAQAAPGSAGGVIDIARRSSGVELGHRWHDDDGALALGIELGRLDEVRHGYENFVGDRPGVRGRLRRNERNRVDSHELHAIADRRLGSAWTLFAGARHTRLEFASADRYFANGDDSGRVRYRETAVALGVARALGNGEIFASAGRGFETPTITESAYRPDGEAGFNRALTSARFVTAEVGLRWRFDAADASVAVYRVEGEDEIVPATSGGGRSSYANAGDTRREGIELGLEGELGAGWRYALAANWVRARFTEAFSYRVSRGGDSQLHTVAAGNRIPGIPQADGFAELAWQAPDARWSAAFEARFSGRIHTDDRNSDAAPGNARFALRARWQPGPTSAWHAFARIDNLFDRDYVGSVIVNDGNGRFFEPAPGRTWTVGIGWQLR